MNRKAVSVVFASLLLAGASILAFNIQAARSSPETWTVDDDGPADFHTIQEAINSSQVMDGDTIYVCDGTYREHVFVNKSVSLVGANRNDTIIDGSGKGNVLHVVADEVHISGFTIQNAGMYGIWMVNTKNSRISNNNIVDNNVGIVLLYTNNNTISSNNITGISKDGIDMYGCTNDTVYGNRILNCSGRCMYVSGSFLNVSNNIVAYGVYDGIFFQANESIVASNIVFGNKYGIWLYNGKNNLFDNNMTDNTYNFGVFGNKESEYDNDVDETNLVDGKPVYYLKNMSNKTFDAQTNGGVFVLFKCENVTIRDQSLKRNRWGVFLWNSTDCNIENIEASSNYYGIRLFYSYENILFGNFLHSNQIGIGMAYASHSNLISRNIVVNSSNAGLTLSTGTTAIPIELHNNTITCNTIANNRRGISFDGSSNNKLAQNNFIENENQTTNADDRAINFWDNGYTSGGNYWSDYTDTDYFCGPSQDIFGSDGMWDRPHVIDANNTDNYPLVKPYVLGNLTVSVSTDKDTYHAGETMRLGLNVTNPDSVKYVCFAIWCRLPDSSIYLVTHQHSVILPIGLEYTNPSFKTFTLPSLPDGVYTWHVAFLTRATHTIVVEDAAEWEFS